MYTPWVNVLDYTSVVIPASKVDAAIDKREANYEPLGDIDKALHDECTHFYQAFLVSQDTDGLLDDPELAHGTPIGFQFVGRRLQEEKMIAIAELVEQALAQKKAGTT